VALLAAFLVPYLMTYTGPVMIVVLLGLAAYVLADILPRDSIRRYRLKFRLLVALVLAANVFPLADTVLARHRAEISGDLQEIVRTSHDGAVLQTEDAMAYLLDGRNPYSEQY
ncbi:MAG: hypothetical protein GTO49_34160, partial [Anaerolineae bacterium]|nr:hypothetical protein [Anaerolineae bacterium]